MNPTPSVSAVIPAYNAEKTIGRTLEALLNQDYGGLFEVIVVDDGSTDQTASVVKSFSKVRYVSQPNSGPAAARNAGFANSGGEFVFFTDSDCVPHKDCIRQLVNGFFTSDIGVVCGSYDIANPHDRLAVCIHQEILFRHQNLMPDYPKAFGSYNFCVRRSVFEAVGGFNTGYRHASGEDNDLSYKILKDGFRIYFERKALVRHYHTTAVIKYLREQYRHGFWRIKMYRDHPQMMKGDGYTFWKDMVEVPLVGLSFFALIASLAGWAELYIFVYLLLFFLTFEFAFGIIFMKSFFIGVWFGLVMFLRAFARTGGFSTGIFHYLLKN